MKIAINGTGVAGPALAWWLRRYGHEPVLFESSPVLRTGGYVIDFWGSGYAVAEKMGLVPVLRARGYRIEHLRMVSRRGRTIADLNVESLRSMVGDRFVSIPRGDIAAAIFEACAGNGVEAHFGESITAIEEGPGGASVGTSLGRRMAVDLVIGTDGLHSAVREIAFGPAAEFEKRLGYYVAAFALPGYAPRDELAYVSHTVPKRQVARVALRQDVTLFLFIFTADAVSSPENIGDPAAMLREVFGDMEWEVPRIIAALGSRTDLYFDHVSQIRMPHWSKGRVALVGDAASCVSFLAGEGTGLAMTQAYVLAGELHRGGTDYAAAFGHYERMLYPHLKRKQRAALRYASFFAPASSFRLFLRNLGMRASAWPPIARAFVGRMLADEFPLPAY